MRTMLALFVAALLVSSEAVAQVAPEADAGGALPTQADGGLLDEGEDDEAEDEDGVPDEAESEAGHPGSAATDGGLLYSADLSDTELERRWLKDVESLGSISVGFAEAGRVINGVQLEPGEAWTVVAPEAAWGTREAIEALVTVAQAVREKLPAAPALRVNHISKKEGGYLRPHHTHQSGRDVDLGFYYKDGITAAAARGAREKLMNLEANWVLVRSLATLADVQVILVDRRIQKILYDYALAAGEDKAWLDQLFRSGAGSLVQHARRHRDHFHVRFYAGRSQELGRRVQPLLAKRPEENLTIHRVRRGDTLGQLARRYGSTVKLIQKANRMTNTRLSVGRTLNIPLRGPCTRCPLPPPLKVPARLLPPGFEVGPVVALAFAALEAGPVPNPTTVFLGSGSGLGGADAGSAPDAGAASTPPQTGPSASSAPGVHPAER